MNSYIESTEAKYIFKYLKQLRNETEHHEKFEKTLIEFSLFCKRLNQINLSESLNYISKTLNKSALLIDVLDQVEGEILKFKPSIAVYLLELDCIDDPA